ncbi:MAG: ribosomal L7Ae/L30e/S12e/Gadd45 family protein [Candidatus Aenigmatarchaeota archaeon]|nr:MAG: ribosomal L7Ae/L30e/S12e/Gadd45 family protein [Candidatus Aenigmarchaeota archaeon]
MTIGKQIKDAIKNDKLIIGSRTVLKNLKNEMLESVVYASNCPEELMKDLNHYSKVSGIKLEEFNGNSVQLGELCGKPFRILIIGMKKAKK